MIPSTTGIRPTIVFVTRCVWPAMTASIVVPWSRLTISTIGPFQGTGGVPSIAFDAVRGPLVDQEDLHPNAGAAEPLGFGLDPLRFREERESGGRRRPKRAPACRAARRR